MTAEGVAWDQIQGTRPSQQDCVRCLSWPAGFHLMLLADGMGGHAAGEIASSIVVESFGQAFQQEAEAPLRERLLDALDVANLSVREQVARDERLAGMGTTLVAVACDSTWLTWVSVGDSPLWLFRSGRVLRLNENHSIGGLLDRRAALGEISDEEAAKSPKRSELTEAILGEEIVQIDAPLEPVAVLPGDVFVIASDGVETCTEEELAGLVNARGRSSADLATAILEAVQRHAAPTQDNASLVVFQPGKTESAGKGKGLL